MIVRHPWYPWIFVSSEGLVYSTLTTGCKPKRNGPAKELCQKRVGKTSTGSERPYLGVGCGRGRKIDTHLLVVGAFRGSRPTGHVVRHLDGEHQNNEIDNLVWGTPKENSADTKRHGTFNPRGIRSRNPSWKSPT